MRVRYVNHNGILIEYDLTQYAEEILEDPPQPAEKTAHPPGSQGRIEVMAARARRGEAIFHDQDARNYEEWFATHKEAPELSSPVGYIGRNRKDKEGCRQVEKQRKKQRGRR